MLSVADVAAALAFYGALLGGMEAYRFPEEDPVLVTLRFGDPEGGVGPIARDAGVPILMDPADQPWGERVAYVADPDGNLVLLTAKTDWAVAGRPERMIARGGSADSPLILLIS